MHLHPYLSFNGRCEEAIEFYKKTLGAQVELLLRFKDSPDPQMCPPGAENKILHTRLRMGNTRVMASDGHNTGELSFQGFTLSLSVATIEEAEKLQVSLSDGGKVQMPLTKTFFSPGFGLVADKFGVTWMIVVDEHGAHST